MEITGSNSKNINIKRELSEWTALTYLDNFLTD